MIWNFKVWQTCKTIKNQEGGQHFFTPLYIYIYSLGLLRHVQRVELEKRNSPNLSLSYEIESTLYWGSKVLFEALQCKFMTAIWRFGHLYNHFSKMTILKNSFTHPHVISNPYIYIYFLPCFTKVEILHYLSRQWPGVNFPPKKGSYKQGIQFSGTTWE